MMMQVRLPARCIDINTPYCPCLLAQTNHCVFCSLLQGGETCSCNWAGVCVLYEKTWQHQAGRGDDMTSTARIETEAAVISRESVAAAVYSLALAVPAELAVQLDKTGAFVFLRRPEDPGYFQFPIGVIKAQGERIWVMVETTGPKTQRILDADTLLVRGPYYNGVFGQPWIDKITAGDIVVVAGGMGQPPALPIMRRLRYNNNRVTAILAPGRMGSIFIDAAAAAMGIQIHRVTSLRREGLGLVRDIVRQEPVNLLVSCGPDAQHYSLLDILRQMQAEIPMAATNNATMCCGEGICGSCQKDTVQGTVIRACKTQTDFSQLL